MTTQSEFPSSELPAPHSISDSGFRIPDSAIRNPQSAIPNPQSAIRNPQSAIRNPQRWTMNANKINVLVVEDSPVMRMLLTHLLEGDPQLQVIGTADNGQEAIDFVAREKPDVILMDANMPEMDGYEATRRIMETRPIPIVISSASLRTEEAGETFHALESGAVAFVEKPVGLGSPGFDQMVQKLRQTVKLMAGVKVVNRK